MPQELRLAGITTVEEANAFLRQSYIGEFNAKFAVAAPQKGTAFRRTSRSDLDWIFTVQTERVVDKDNTVAIGDRPWQLEKSRFRSTLAGCIVTIHEHLDETVSIRFGPHTAGRYTADGQPLRPRPQPESRGKAGPVRTVENPIPVFHRSHRPWKSRRGIPTFPPLRRRFLSYEPKPENPHRQADEDPQAETSWKDFLEGQLSPAVNRSQLQQSVNRH